MTADELRDAVQNVLKTRNTDEEADAVVKLLDRDGDGQITKHELLYYTQKTRDKVLAERGGDDDDEEEDDDEAHKIKRLPSLEDRDMAPPETDSTKREGTENKLN
jgi:Ca2+-binding EF-hand superfamily protein